MEPSTSVEAAAAELANATDWTSVGLVLAGLGACLIGVAILARGKRGLARELFGAHAGGVVRLRETLFQRALLVVGFGWLAAGFALQLLGRLRPAAAPEFPVAWAGAVLVATLLLLGLAWAWALRAARAAVRAHLALSPRDLAHDLAFARELGHLFGVESRAEDSVESYLGRLEAALGLPRRPRTGSAGPMPAAPDGFDEADELD